jgi:hypothetical protein
VLTLLDKQFVRFKRGTFAISPLFCEEASSLQAYRNIFKVRSKIKTKNILLKALEEIIEPESFSTYILNIEPFHCF